MKRTEILARIQPAVDALVDQLLALAPELARSHLSDLLGALPTAAVERKRVGRDTKPEKKERTNTCRKCGAIGFTARTCGKTHNVESAPRLDEAGSLHAHRSSSQGPKCRLTSMRTRTAAKRTSLFRCSPQ